MPKGSRYKDYDYEEGRGEVKDFTKKTLPVCTWNGVAAAASPGLQQQQRPAVRLHPDAHGCEWRAQRFHRAAHHRHGSDHGEAKHEYIYRQSGPTNQDKIGDAVYDAERNALRDRSRQRRG